MNVHVSYSSGLSRNPAWMSEFCIYFFLNGAVLFSYKTENNKGVIFKHLQINIKPHISGGKTT